MIKLNELTTQDIVTLCAKFNITRDTLQKLLTIDPTAIVHDTLENSKKGNYLNWLIKIYKQFEVIGTLSDFFAKENLIRNGLYFFSELSKRKTGKEYLQELFKNKNLSEADISDIMHYSFEDISALGMYATDKDFLYKALTPKEKQIEVIINDSVMFVCIPKTHEAARKYGTGTRWCTATSNIKWWNGYLPKGPLFIIIDKTTNNPTMKWQYCNATGELQNPEREQISKADFITYWYNKGEEGAEAISALIDYFENECSYLDWDFKDIFEKNKENYKEVLTKLFEGKTLNSAKNSLYKIALNFYDTPVYYSISENLSFMGVLLSGVSTNSELINIANYYHSLGFKPIATDIIFFMNTPRNLKLLFQYNSDLIQEFISMFLSNDIPKDVWNYYFTDPDGLEILYSIANELKKKSFYERAQFILTVFSNNFLDYLEHTTSPDKYEQIDTRLVAFFIESIPELWNKKAFQFTETHQFPAKEINPENLLKQKYKNLNNAKKINVKTLLKLLREELKAQYSELRGRFPQFIKLIFDDNDSQIVNIAVTPLMKFAYMHNVPLSVDIEAALYDIYVNNGLESFITELLPHYDAKYLKKLFLELTTLEKAEARRNLFSLYRAPIKLRGIYSHLEENFPLFYIHLFELLIFFYITEYLPKKEQNPFITVINISRQLNLYKLTDGAAPLIKLGPKFQKLLQIYEKPIYKFLITYITTELYEAIAAATFETIEQIYNLIGISSHKQIELNLGELLHPMQPSIYINIEAMPTKNAILQFLYKKMKLLKPQAIVQKQQEKYTELLKTLENTFLQSPDTNDSISNKEIHHDL
ncbi:MAG TPA: hypothetical protein P5140_08090 [Methanofastidiosum sp.]|nr:hypothetical protein [Methanofastidiosum sp.]